MNGISLFFPPLFFFPAGGLNWFPGALIDRRADCTGWALNKAVEKKEEDGNKDEKAHSSYQRQPKRESSKEYNIFF